MSITNRIKPKQFRDYYLYGGLNSEGQIREVYDMEAIKNALVLWMGSKRGEYVNNPSSGGFLYYHLQKPMSEERTEQIKLSLLQGLKKDFYPSLIITNISVQPDYENKYYQIEVSGYSPTVGTYFSVGENFRNFSI